MPPAIARHPKTGEPIRIITSDASTWRSQKTLVWLTQDSATVSKAWDRWDIGVVGSSEYLALKAAGIQADILLLLEAADGCQFLTENTAEARALKIIVLSRSAVDAIGLERLARLRLENLLCLDEMADLYPHTGPKWIATANESTADAKVLVALALRACRTFPLETSAVPAERLAIAEKVGLRLSGELVAPPPLILINQYYTPEKAKRRKEIDACLEANVANPWIDQIVLLNERAFAPSKSSKVVETVLGKRLTYADVLRWIRDHAPADALVAFANSDIFLDPGATTRLLWSVDMTNTFFALLRYDVTDTSLAAQAAATLFGPRPDSQDTWIVSAASVKAAFGEAELAPFEFPFGQGGCDNAITLEMFKKRFAVVNPALTLRTYHLHTSAVRTYDPRDIVSKPAYLYIQPTGLHDMRPDLGEVPSGATRVALKRKSFARPVVATGQGQAQAQTQARTFCTMVGRSTEGRIALDVDSANLWAPTPVPVAIMEDVFQTRQGLAYTYNSLLVGSSKAGTEAWAESELSSMAAAMRVEEAAIVPLSDAVAEDPAAYVLQYLSKVLLLRKELPAAEFWCSKRAADCGEALRLFRWPRAEMPVLARDDLAAQTWCKRAAIWPHMDGARDGLTSQEEVDALREALGGAGWLAEAETPRRVVVAVDGTWVTDETVDRLEGAGLTVKAIWPCRTGVTEIVEALRGAWGFVTADQKAASWSWALPAGAFLWEIQNEMSPSAATLHLAAAAQLQHRLLITPKGSATGAERSAICEKLSKALEMEGAQEQTLRPVIVLPEPPKVVLPAAVARKDIFGHAGDSFREMVRLWGERGFVTVEESPDVTQVWLGGVGRTLLYDRPTLEWLKAAPAAESKAALSLFGNPAPPVAAGRASPWTFWPRRPRLVEEAVARGLAATPFEQRPDGLVFYGRSENAVQRGNRTRADWSAACDKWVHMVGGDASYPFSQAEYLEQLAKARYGLCLAGYGRKCHREIECMAMGCVPVVAPEVDMSNYADPPKVGVHYFRVMNPQEALHVVRNMPAERWRAMSAACRAWWERNASVVGSWVLTQRLAAGDASGGSA